MTEEEREELERLREERDRQELEYYREENRLRESWLKRQEQKRKLKVIELIVILGAVGILLLVIFGGAIYLEIIGRNMEF